MIAGIDVFNVLLGIRILYLAWLLFMILGDGKCLLKRGKQKRGWLT